MVAILILVDGFLQLRSSEVIIWMYGVAILILVDGFLQLRGNFIINKHIKGRNPYFSRWFSAIAGYEPQKEYILLSQSLF